MSEIQILMNIFSIFKKRKTEPQKLMPAELLKLTQEYVPDFYKDTEKFKESKEFLKNNELGLALDTLIEMANESGHFFSKDFWLSLAVCAEKMQMTKQGEFCKQQIVRNKREIGNKIPKGWAIVKIDDHHFEHHKAQAVKNIDEKKKNEGDFFEVTTQKLKIFEKYGGSSGDYDRANKKDLVILPYSHFMLIDRLVQDIKLVEKGLAAQSFKDTVEKTIQESCDSDDTISYLRNIATNS